MTLRILSFAAVAACTSSASPQPNAGSCVGHAASGIGAYDSGLLARVQASPYIVEATVTRTGASTVPGDANTPHEVIAHVDQVVFAGAEIAELGGTWGDTITIDVTGPALGVGARVFLLAQVELYNAGQLAVREVGRVDTASYPHIATDIPRIETLFAQDPLYARIATSARIVHGTVTATRSFGAACGSEHCPDWQISDVAVEDLLCGSAAGDAPVKAGFAGSRDLAWSEAPKLAAGQDGLLLLHDPVAPVAFSTSTPDPLVVDPLDVHPAADEAAIAALLANPPALP